MSIIKSIQAINTKAMVGIIDPSTYREAMTDIFLAGGQGPLHQFMYTDYSSSLTAYERCPPLTAIINKKAQAYINGKTWVMDGKGKVAETSYAKKIRVLIDKPNPLQTWKQFEAQNYIYQQIFGFCIVLPIIPVGWKGNENATSLWNIPGNMICTKESGKLWYQTDLSGIVESIKLTYKGSNIMLPLDKIYIFKDFSPSFNSMIFPESRIRSLAPNISNCIGSLESRGVLINYRGALGMITNNQKDPNGYIPLKDPDKLQLQKDFLRYGLKDQQWKFIITSADLKWQSMAVPTRDLMLFEEMEDDIYRMCDGYGYPDYLMAGGKAGTYANVSEAKQSLYQDTIIPEADSMYDQWNIFFNAAANGCLMEKDYSHIPTLQEDRGKLATARKTMGEELEREFKNNWITYNRVLELLFEDTIPGADKYYRELLADGWIFGNTTQALPPQNNQA